MANIDELDLNLLRVFDAVYRMGNVSRAAELLGLSQPATSQALTRLRLLLRDPLFLRASNGVRPTERADRLARSVQGGLLMLASGLAEDDVFDPLNSTAELRLHLTDIGEARFLPRLMEILGVQAPRLQVQAKTWPQSEIASALEEGQLHFAIGFLPATQTFAKMDLITDRYNLLLRAGHPFHERMRGKRVSASELAELEYVAIRSHSDTMRILRIQNLEHRVRLITSNFLALPGLIRSTDLAVLMPRAIALTFEPVDKFCVMEPDVPQKDFTVSLHWSRRHEHAAMNRWFKDLLIKIFRT